MTTSINTSIKIKAPKALVWSILMDFEAYPLWNPFVVKIKGGNKLGDKLKIFLKIKGPNIPLSVKVRQLIDEEFFAWGGGLPFIFSGEHCFKLIEEEGKSKEEQGYITLKHYENFEGIMAYLSLRGSAYKTVEQQYIALNIALKKRAETLSQQAIQAGEV